MDIGKSIAEALGVEARFRLVQAGETLDADLLNYVWKGAAVGGHVSDVMLHVPYDSEYACRIEQVTFTGQYATETIRRHPSSATTRWPWKTTPLPTAT
ncbi:hypothetical protein PZN02_005305 [Sinorhizobium garamanticum]|uniref:Uncharacterized protein n=1 Tax=Sinorhizobium garamanticum TaxID=680247 RepID=A0ABY8DKA5_9HYPH|nr:hypothetical protein [Sinorhizobium garamanticum]WEX89965.1 hypothetical protein PZN02_005305 [Sinorhizobium garamanticum]